MGERRSGCTKENILNKAFTMSGTTENEQEFHPVGKFQ